MIKVLFICHGNICRSPMAEFIMKKLVKKIKMENDFIIESAATSCDEIYNGIGNPVYPPAKKELNSHGINCDNKSAVQLKKADYDMYDYLIGMDDRNISNIKRIIGNANELSDKTNNKIHMLMDFTNCKKEIADPWYTNNFKQTFSDIYSGCVGLLEYLLTSKNAK